MKNDIIDADWTPSQQRAARYIKDTTWKRDAKKTVQAQRFCLFALALLIVVMAVALVVK